MDEYFKGLAKNLLRATDGCRDDMHDPDVQGVSARVVGDRLNNAHGEEVDPERIAAGQQELVVLLYRDGSGSACYYVPQFRFNLSSLIALARAGAAHMLKEEPR
ncbi:MAG: hypothetical protein WC683_04140 [bacterium]